MPQCEGTTKAGARCKRDATDGPYCAFHVDQASDEGGGSTGGRPEKRSTDLLLIGVVALALVAIRRVIRF